MGTGLLPVKSGFILFIKNYQFPLQINTLERETLSYVFLLLTKISEQPCSNGGPIRQQYFTTQNILFFFGRDAQNAMVNPRCSGVAGRRGCLRSRRSLPKFMYVNTLHFFRLPR
jgi:hypothetical protein